MSKQCLSFYKEIPFLLGMQTGVMHAVIKGFECKVNLKNPLSPYQEFSSCSELFSLPQSLRFQAAQVPWCDFSEICSLTAIVSEMGILKLFTAGLPLRIAMVGTLTGLQWYVLPSLLCCPVPLCAHHTQILSHIDFVSHTPLWPIAEPT